MTTMTTEDKVRNLSNMTTKDHAGRHFTERYPDDVISELESLSLIEITRPVHDRTGLEYDRQHWKVMVTQEGADLVEANPEYHEVD